MEIYLFIHWLDCIGLPTVEAFSYVSRPCNNYANRKRVKLDRADYVLHR